MWKKILIFQHKLSNYNHTGFIINYKENKIVNLLNNYTIILPFSLCICENLYQYELLFTTTTLNLNMMINLQRIKSIVVENKKVPFKNELFKILNYSKTNIVLESKIKSINFNELSCLENLLCRYKYIKYTKENVLRLKDIEFNLIEETISYIQQNKYKHINLFFIFCNTITNMINSVKNLCIVDDESNYKSFDGLIINRKNYRKMDITTLKSYDRILFDKKLFFSRAYVNSYREYHNNYKSIYAFNNYQNYIYNTDNVSPFYNIELLSTLNIIFNDVDVKKIQQHPVRFSKNTKIFNFTNINDDIVEQSCSFLLSYSKLRYNQLFELQSWPYHPFYLSKNLLYISNNITTINITNHCSQTKLSYELINKSNNGFCDVYKTDIGDKSYYKFNCGHKFMIDNFKYFDNNYVGCFSCQAPIESIKYYVNSDTAIKDLLGSDFADNFSTDNYYYFLDVSFPNKIKFLSHIFGNISNINKYGIVNNNLQDNSIVCIPENISNFEIINLISSMKTTNKIVKIIKLSLSI